MERKSSFATGTYRFCWWLINSLQHFILLTSLLITTVEYEKERSGCGRALRFSDREAPPSRRICMLIGEETKVARA